MKKILFVALLAIAGLNNVSAQGTLNGGLNIGIPTGDVEDLTSLTLGAELNYMFPVASGFTLGPSVQYSHFFGKDIEAFGGTIEVDDISFIPISAAARFNITEKFVLGANLGYALGIDEGNEGGFYYRPVLGFKVGDSSQLNISYSGIDVDGVTFSSFSLGIMFGL